MCLLISLNLRHLCFTHVHRWADTHTHTCALTDDFHHGGREVAHTVVSCPVVMDTAFPASIRMLLQNLSDRWVLLFIIYFLFIIIPTHRRGRCWIFLNFCLLSTFSLKCFSICLQHFYLKLFQQDFQTSQRKLVTRRQWNESVSHETAACEELLLLNNLNNFQFKLFVLLCINIKCLFYGRRRRLLCVLSYTEFSGLIIWINWQKCSRANSSPWGWRREVAGRRIVCEVLNTWSHLYKVCVCVRVLP